MTVTSDLLICILLIVLLSVWLFLVGIRVGDHASRVISALVAGSQQQCLSSSQMAQRQSDAAAASHTLREPAPLVCIEGLTQNSLDDVAVWDDDPGANDLTKWPLPAIVTVSLPGLRTSGLSTGVGHSIVVERAEQNGKVDVADPFAGRRIWTRQQLIDAYGGDLIAIIPIGKITSR